VFGAERTYASRGDTSKRLPVEDVMFERPNLARLSVSSLLCLLGFATNAAEPKESPVEPHATTPRSLDLKAPLLTSILSEQQIDMVLANTVDPELEHVEVEASRINDVPFSDRSASAGEVAFREVTRWFVPYPTTLAAQVNATPDFTDSYRAVPVQMAWYMPNFPGPASQR
jgi:hypothetical protein